MEMDAIFAMVWICIQCFDFSICNAYRYIRRGNIRFGADFAQCHYAAAGLVHYPVVS